MRCDSRLKYAEFLSHDARFPIILPHMHQVTKLIVKYFHKEGNHASGMNQTLAVLSTRFWIISEHEEIEEREKECNECRRPKLQSKLWHLFHRSDFGYHSDLLRKKL